MQTAILTADRRFFTGGGDGRPFAAAFQRGVKASHPGRRGSSPSTQARKQRGRCQGHQPEHQMAPQFADVGVDREDLTILGFG